MYGGVFFGLAYYGFGYSTLMQVLLAYIDVYTTKGTTYGDDYTTQNTAYTDFYLS